MNGRRFSRRANPQDTNGSIVICKVKGRDSKIRDMGNGEVQNIRGVGCQARIYETRDIRGTDMQGTGYRGILGKDAAVPEFTGGIPRKGHLTTVPSYIARASERVCRHDVLCPSGNAAGKQGRSDSAARTGVEAGGEAEAIARIRDGGASENSIAPVFCSCLGMI